MPQDPVCSLQPLTLCSFLDLLLAYSLSRASLPPCLVHFHCPKSNLFLCAEDPGFKPLDLWPYVPSKKQPPCTAFHTPVLPPPGEASEHTVLNALLLLTPWPSLQRGSSVPKQQHSWCVPQCTVLPSSLPFACFFASNSHRESRVCKFTPVPTRLVTSEHKMSQEASPRFREKALM